MAFGRIVELRKPSSIFGEAIQVGCLNFAAVTTNVRESQVINHDDNKVRSISGRAKAGRLQRTEYRECAEGEQQ